MDDSFVIEEARSNEFVLYPTIITKYELATLIRLRTQQLDAGMEPMIPNEECEGIYDNTVIAEKEIRQGVCSIEIIRPHKGGTRRIRITGNEVIQDH